MKKYLFAIVLLISCLSNSSSIAATETFVNDSLSSAPETTAGSDESSSFITKSAGQAMIDSFTTVASSTTTKYYLADAAQLKAYLDYAIQNSVKDMQIILAKNDSGAATLVITFVKSDGSHILYPNPNNNNTPSVLENLTPCPPSVNCYTSTNLNN